MSNINYKEIMKGIATVAIVILAIDFLGFMAWVASNQYPADGFYIGAITKNILAIIIN